MSRATRSAILAVMAGAVAVAPTSAGAAEATDAGWWWKPQSGQLVALPPPPGVPEGGLYVQSAVDGASAIAAVRYDLGDDESAPVLQLRLAEEGNQGADAAIVLACPATTPWQSGPAQPWGEKPVPDCGRQAVGTLSEDGTTMSFDLSTVASGPVLDVVLVPGTVEGLPEGINGASFAIAFEAPADGDVVTQRGSSSTPPAPSGSPPPSGSASPAGSSSGGSSFVPGATGSALPPPAPPVAPALPAAEVAAPTTPAATPSGGSGSSFAPVSAPDASDARKLAVGLLLAAAVGTLLVGQRDQVLRLLGRAPVEATAAPVVLGIGRFVRERPGPPPSLR